MIGILLVSIVYYTPNPILNIQAPALNPCSTLIVTFLKEPLKQPYSNHYGPFFVPAVISPYPPYTRIVKQTVKPHWVPI